jgi:hypothetical protein
MFLQHVIEVNYVFLFLHVKANLPSQSDNKMREMCFKHVCALAVCSACNL